MDDPTTHYTEDGIPHRSGEETLKAISDEELEELAAFCRKRVEEERYAGISAPDPDTR